MSDGSHFIKMNGREVFRFATTVMPRATESVARKAGWKAEELDIIIPHQANVRIIESAAKRLSVPVDKFFVNLERYGNTSAASIPTPSRRPFGRTHQAGRPDGHGGLRRGADVGGGGAGVGVPIPTRPLPWWRRVFSPVLWFFAGLRSASIRTERHVYNQIMGPVGKDDWRGHLRKNTDAVRQRVRARLKR